MITISSGRQRPQTPCILPIWTGEINVNPFPGVSGQIQGCRGAAAGFDWMAWHDWQDVARASMALSAPPKVASGHGFHSSAAWVVFVKRF